MCAISQGLSQGEDVEPSCREGRNVQENTNVGLVPLDELTNSVHDSRMVDGEAWQRRVYGKSRKEEEKMGSRTGRMR